MIIAVNTPPVAAVASQLAGVVYSQSSVYGTNKAATYAVMNNGNADGSANDSQTGTLSGSPVSWIAADTGAVRWIDRVVLGYDYKNNLIGGWGPAYTQGRKLQGSTDGSAWTDIATTPTFNVSTWPNGLVPVDVKGTWRHLRVYTYGNYTCLLEFEVWGY